MMRPLLPLLLECAVIVASNVGDPVLSVGAGAVSQVYILKTHLRRLLLFLLGAFSLGFAIQPYVVTHWRWQLLKEYAASIQTNVIEPHTKSVQESKYHFFPARFDKVGVIQHEPLKMMPGLTLFSASHEPAAYLIDAGGRVVHKWKISFSTAFADSTQIELPVPDEYIFMRRTHVFTNGDLLAIYEAPGFWPYAYGLVKLDRNSRVLWRYDGMINHDLEVTPDGSVYTLLHGVRKLPQAGLEMLDSGRVIDDVLVILNPDGTERERYSILDAFARSHFSGLLGQGGSRDVLHTNSVQVITQKMAEATGIAAPGQILLSNQAISAVSVFDPKTQSITWLRRGSWRFQHSARITANGALIMFDNMGGLNFAHQSRALVIEPATGAELWSYSGDAARPLFSEQRGSVQELGNGNVLITESNAGRLLEVDGTGRVVWEFVIDYRKQGKTPALFDALRVDETNLKFLRREGAH